MAIHLTQLNLPDVLDLKLIATTPRQKTKRKRGLPSYKKVYSVYVSDRDKYTNIFKKLNKLAEKLNNPDIVLNASPYKILNHCYIYEDGEKKHQGDEKHIFRYRSLHKIYELIYQYGKSPVGKLQLTCELEWEQQGVSFYWDWETGGEACIISSQDLPLKQRIKIHIKMLRLLRSGYDIKRAAGLCQKMPVG